MANPSNKILFLSWILLLPLSSLAGNCLSNDSECQINQMRLAAMEKANIQPTAVVTAPGAANNPKKSSSGSQSIETQQPFKIPLPLSAQSQKIEQPPVKAAQLSTTKQNFQPLQSLKAQTNLNIFAPNQPDQNSSQNNDQDQPNSNLEENQTDSSSQLPKSGPQLLLPNKQLSKIQYH